MSDRGSPEIKPPCRRPAPAPPSLSHLERAIWRCCEASKDCGILSGIGGLLKQGRESGSARDKVKSLPADHAPALPGSVGIFVRNRFRGPTSIRYRHATAPLYTPSFH